MDKKERVRVSSRQSTLPDHSGSEAAEEEGGDVFDAEGNLIPTHMVVPPDGGWGWVILGATFCCNMLVDGNSYAFGMYMKVIPEDLKVTRATVAVVGSLLQGFSSFVGPVVSALCNKYGFRTVAVLGSLVSCAGFASSYYATSITFLCFTYGVIGGVGFGMVSLPATIVIGFYFDRWRALATCISACGSSVGAGIIPPLIEYLLSEYGWRKSMLFQGALMLSCIVFSLLFQPLLPTPIVPSHVNDATDKHGRRRFKFNTAQRARIESERSRLLLSHPASSSDDVTRDRRALPTRGSPVLPGGRANGILGPSNSCFPTYARSLGQQSDGRSTAVSGDEWGGNEGRGRRKRESSTSSWMGVRPMYRDDILYGSDLTRLSKYRSHDVSSAYNQSVSHLPSRRDVEEDGRCVLCPEAVRRTLATMLDLSLLNSPTFLLLTLSVCVKSASVYVPSIFLPDRALTMDADPTVVSLLITLMSGASMMSRILCGVLISLCAGVNSTGINSVSLTVGGVATIAIGLFTSSASLIVYCIVFGFSLGCFNSLHSIVIVELLGLERLTNAFGLSSLFQGIAMMIGPPLAGWFKESTGSYDAVFWFAGTLMLVSALLAYPLTCVSHHETRKQREHYYDSLPSSVNTMR